jgi:hypothetical protein
MHSEQPEMWHLVGQVAQIAKAHSRARSSLFVEPATKSQSAESKKNRAALDCALRRIFNE